MLCYVKRGKNKCVSVLSSKVEEEEEEEVPPQTQLGSEHVEGFLEAGPQKLALS